MTNWPKDRLGNLLTIITDYHANGSYKKLKENVRLLEEPDYAIMIRTTNFEKEDFLNDLRFINEHAYSFLSKSKIQPGDILMNKIANPGSVYLMPDLQKPVSLGMNLFLIRTDPKKLNQTFAYFYLKANEAYIKGFTTGAATATITKKAVKGLMISKPDLREQKKIAAILSAYDDLIENNRRRIQLLEQASRLLYKEWFVNFRFPGYEHVKIKNGVPEGWTLGTVGEKATLIRGKSYKSNELVASGGKPFVNLKCVARHGGFRLDGLKCFSGSHKDDQIVIPGDIVIAVTDMTRERLIVAHSARIPKIVGKSAVFSMDTVKIIPNGCVNKIWFYCFLRFSNFPREAGEHATGTNVLHLKPKQISEYITVFPSLILQDQFGAIVQPLFDQLDNLIIQIEQLSQARDLLLPGLMSGEIKV